MTTPAIAIDARQSLPGQTYSIIGGVKQNVKDSQQFSRWHAESRPASTSNVLSHGWRQPSGWSHSLTDASPAPASGVSWLSDSRQPGKTDGEYVTDTALWTQTMTALDSIDGQLANRAVIQALNRLKNQRVNLAQAFAEREQTVRLLAGAASTIAKSVQAYRSKNPRKIWDTIVRSEGHPGKSIPNSWLELQYGWNPLMSDVAGSYETLKNRDADGKRYIITVRGQAKKKTSISWLKTTAQTGLLGIQVTGIQFQQCKVRLDYYLENPLLASLSQLGVTNPIALAWELVPYSFVVDWFSPIGQALSAMDAALGYQFRGGTSTSYRKLEEEGHGWAKSSVSVPGNPSLTYHGFGFPSYYNRRMAMVRSVFSSSPLPRFPGFKNPLSSGHIANALALLATAFR